MKKYNYLRISLGILYFLTSFINLYLGMTSPEMIRSLAETALITPYKYFAENVPIFILRISLIGFFVYQILLSFLLLNRGECVKWGIIGGIIFHVGILPWGTWSWPNLLFVIIYILLLRKEYKKAACEIVFN